MEPSAHVQDSVYYAFINMTHIGFGNFITILQDKELDNKLGPWMLACKYASLLTERSGWTYVEVEHKFSEGTLQYVIIILIFRKS